MPGPSPGMTASSRVGRFLRYRIGRPPSSAPSQPPTPVLLLKPGLKPILAPLLAVLACCCCAAALCRPAPAAARMLVLRTAALDSPPTFYTDHTGAKHGLCMDIMRAVEAADPDIRFVGQDAFLPHRRMERRLEDGRLDVIFGMSATQARRRFLVSDTALYTVRLVLAKRADDPAAPSTIHDLAALPPQDVVLAPAHSASARHLRQMGLGNVNDGARDVQAMLRMLRKGRGRFACHHDLGLNHTITRFGLQGEVSLLPASLHEAPHYAFFSRRADPEAVAAVEAALARLKEQGKLEAIVERYRP